MDMMTSEVSRRSMLGLFSLAAALPLVGCASVPRAAESAPAWRTKSVRSQTDGLNIVYHEAGRGKPLVIVNGGGSNAEPYRNPGYIISPHSRVLPLGPRNHFDTGPP